MQALATAWHDNVPIALLGSVEATDAAAYGVQEQVFLRRCTALGTTLAGYKISMTSPAGLALVGATEPAYGRLSRADVLPTGATVSLSAMNAPMLEPELVFLVRRDLAPGAGENEIAAGCDLAPGIEVPDSRFRDWFSHVGPFELIADCAVAGRLVVGAERVSADAVDLAAIQGDIVSEGRVVAVGDAATVMGNPLRAVAWLSDRLRQRGHTLRAGMVVSSGTFTMPVPAASGSYTARYPGLGSVAVTFEA